MCIRDRLYLAEEQTEDAPPDTFYRGTVTAEQATFFMVRWDDFALDESNPEAIPKDSYRIWHGTMADDAWEQVCVCVFGLVRAFLHRLVLCCDVVVAPVACWHFSALDATTFTVLARLVGICCFSLDHDLAQVEDGSHAPLSRRLCPDTFAEIAEAHLSLIHI